MAPAAVARIASTPPVGNPIACPASLGVVLEEAFAAAVADDADVEASVADVGDAPEVGEPAPAEASELCEDSLEVAALELSVWDAAVAVAVALTVFGSLR